MQEKIGWKLSKASWKKQDMCILIFALTLYGLSILAPYIPNFSKSKNFVFLKRGRGIDANAPRF